MRRLTGNKQFGRKEFGRSDERGNSRNNSFVKRDSPRGDDREGGFQKHNSPRFGRDNEGFEKKMHRVTCDKCGEACEVPFRPTGDKPVYCSRCFRKNESTPSGKPSRNDLDEVNEKLDKIMRALNIE